MPIKKKKPVVEKMERLNTRLRKDQRKFVKAQAKRERKTEGETFREIVDFYINHKKK